MHCLELQFGVYKCSWEQDTLDKTVYEKKNFKIHKDKSEK
jgi:hypothetical protein